MHSFPARAALGAALVLSTAAAQVDAPLPTDLALALGVRAGSVQHLVLPHAGGAPFRVNVALGGEPVELALRPHDVRTPDFRLLVDDGRGPREVPAPASTTYRGAIVGRPGSVVAASLVDRQLSATIAIGGALWGIDSLAAHSSAAPASAHVVYRRRNVQLPPGVRCGLTGAMPGGAALHRGPSFDPAAIKVAEIGIDADFDYYRRNGSNVTATQNAVTRVMNGVDAIYKRDVEITFKITAIVVRTGRVYFNSNMQSLLRDFQNRWNSAHGSIRRDLAHLFTGKGSFSGIIGIAYLGVVCNTGVAYGVSKAFHGSSAVNVGLVAHEIGHNFNAPHCNSSPPCNIMCSGLGGCNRNYFSFGGFSINVIKSFKSRLGCLSDPPADRPATLTSIAPMSLTSRQGGVVTLTGTLLDTVSAVTVGSARILSLQKIGSTRLLFTLPAPFEIANHDVRAVNNKGPSNALKLDVKGSHPSVADIPVLLARGFANPFKIHTDRSWSALLLVSTSNQPSDAPGLVRLGIGAGFSSLLQVGVFPAGTDGLAATMLTIPTSVPSFTTLHWQAVTFDPRNITTPFETSNVVTNRTL